VSSDAGQYQGDIPALVGDELPEGMSGCAWMLKQRAYLL
jgi:hypothetical protein